MRAPVLTFFNNKGGVGKTSLIYHLAWMYSESGKKVVVADLDPQANLTAAFLFEDDINKLWDGQTIGSTIYQCLKPLTGVEDIAEPVLHKVNATLFLIPGDVALSGFEDALAAEWPRSMDDNNNLYRPMRMLSAFLAGHTKEDLVCFLQLPILPLKCFYLRLLFRAHSSLTLLINFSLHSPTP